MALCPFWISSGKSQPCAGCGRQWSYALHSASFVFTWAMKHWPWSWAFSSFWMCLPNMPDSARPASRRWRRIHRNAPTGGPHHDNATCCLHLRMFAECLLLERQCPFNFETGEAQVAPLAVLTCNDAVCASMCDSGDTQPLSNTQPCFRYQKNNNN